MTARCRLKKSLYRLNDIKVLQIRIVLCLRSELELLVCALADSAETERHLWMLLSNLPC
jgi:hypothetical protein